MKRNQEFGLTEHLSTGFVAELCGVSSTTALRWIRKNYLKAFRLPTSHYRVHRDDLEQFLNKYQIPQKRYT